MVLASDVSPGQVARFAPRIACPRMPGDYTLTIDLLSENVTWFADQGGPPIRMAVKVRPLDLEHFLSEPVGIVGRAPAVAISTDRSSYRRGETLRLTMDAFNQYYPGRFLRRTPASSRDRRWVDLPDPRPATAGARDPPSGAAAFGSRPRRLPLVCRADRGGDISASSQSRGRFQRRAVSAASPSLPRLAPCPCDSRPPVTATATTRR